MYNSRCRLIPILYISRHAHRFLLFLIFNKIEWILEADLCIKTVAYVWFSRSYVYTINIIKQQLKRYIEAVMSKAEQRKIDYWKLNEYLSRKDQGNEELYEYLNSCKDQMGNYKYGQSAVDAEAIENHLRFEGIGEEMTILQESQDYICVDIYQRSNELADLEKELKRTRNQVNALKELVQRYRKNEDSQLCNRAQREANLLIQPTKIKEIRAETEQILAKIELTSLLHLDIDGLALENKRRQHQMKQQIQEASKPSNNSLALTMKTRDELQAEIDSLKLKLSAIRQGTGQTTKSQSEEEFLRCMQERKTLQWLFLQEQTQKRQFYELLTAFKATFTTTKQKNKNLKKLMSEKGLSLSMPSSKQKPQS